MIIYIDTQSHNTSHVHLFFLSLRVSTRRKIFEKEEENR